MGCCRGGLSRKILALIDACRLPILLELTEDQALGTLKRAIEHKERMLEPGHAGPDFES